MQPHERYKSAFDEWVQMREEQERQPQAPGEFIGAPRNFLPPEKRQTFVTPAGVPGAGAADPFPNRVTADQRRQQQAALAHEIERATRLSGSGTIRNAREDAHRGWAPVVERDAAGRIYTRWQRDPRFERDDGDRTQIT